MRPLALAVSIVVSAVYAIAGDAVEIDGRAGFCVATTDGLVAAVIDLEPGGGDDRWFVELEDRIADVRS